MIFSGCLEPAGAGDGACPPLSCAKSARAPCNWQALGISAVILGEPQLSILITTPERVIPLTKMQRPVLLGINIPRREIKLHDLQNSSKTPLCFQRGRTWKRVITIPFLTGNGATKCFLLSVCKINSRFLS